MDIIIKLLAGLGAFLLSFKILSENIEKLANAGLKKLFNRFSKNRFAGVGVGALITAIIQSSSATTVMIVGFVNAGVMDLFQATSMIMGANIGTTITAQIVALNSFDFAKFATLFACIGVFMNMLAKKEKTKTIGLILSGMGLVFISLGLMSDSMSGVRGNPGIQEILSSVNNPLLLLLIGAVITGVIQSSAAVATIIISMVGAGLTIGVDPNAVLYVILGTNIGTCVTALISSLGASVNAKRASLIHLLFNVFGSLIFFLILLVWKNFKIDVLERFFANEQTQIAMFHTIFNVISTIIFLPCVGLFVKISKIIVHDKSEPKKTTYLDDRLLKSPGVALGQAVKETVRLGKISIETLKLSIDKFIERSTDSEEIIHNNIKDIETLNREIITYLVNVSAQDVTIGDEKLISSLHHVLNDFIRESEIADNIVKYTNKVINNNIEFSEKVNEDIKKMSSLLEVQFKNIEEIMLENNLKKIHDVKKVEDIIDNMRSTLINGHIKRLEEGKCKPQSSGIFINLISNLERAGDHLDYIADEMTQNN